VEVNLSDFPDRARITFDPTAGAYAGTVTAPDGDYPNLRVGSTTSAISIEVIHATDGGPDAWNKCLGERGKAAGGAAADAKRRAALNDCAKKYPLRFAWFHALYDEARRIVDGTATSATCSTGYLCGTGCTPRGATCCIDVGHTDQNCPGGALCTSDGQCSGGTSPPTVATGGGGGAGGMCTCGDGTIGCCGRGCCSHHGGVR
jgi:hypothetical protein